MMSACNCVERIVASGAAIREQDRQANAGGLLHGLKHVGHLKCD